MAICHFFFGKDHLKADKVVADTLTRNAAAGIKRPLSLSQRSWRTHVWLSKRLAVWWSVTCMCRMEGRWLNALTRLQLGTCDEMLINSISLGLGIDQSTLVNWSLGIKSSLIDINSSFIESTGPFLRTTCCRESRKMEKSPPDGQTTWTSHNRWRGMMVLQNSAFSMVNGHEQACFRVFWWVGRLLSSPCQNSLIHKRIVVDCVSQWSKP